MTKAHPRDKESKVKCSICSLDKPIFKTCTDERRANRPTTYWNGGYRAPAVRWCHECWKQHEQSNAAGKRRDIARTLMSVPKSIRRTILKNIKADGNCPARRAK